jgi:hypothetical protein
LVFSPPAYLSVLTDTFPLGFAPEGDMAKVFQIGFARAEPEGIFAAGDLQEALAVSWVAGATITRYGRTWLLTRPLSQERIWTGRIGFIREGEFTTVGWDPQALDFRTEQAPGGVIVPFAVNTATGTAAFQLRAGVVRPATFAGALSGLLNRNPTYRWQVSPLAVVQPFSQWRESVTRVTRARFRLEQPNPGWEDRAEVEHILQDLDAEIARLEARAAHGHGLNTQGNLFQQALDHVLRRYGRAVVRGVDARDRETEWDSMGGGTMPVKAELEVAGEPDEVPTEALVEELDRREVELQEARVQEADDEEEEDET